MSATDTEPRPGKLSGHSYDGIQEYDNPMPGWWVATFIATIVFAIGYFVYYHSGMPDRSVKDEYAEAQAADFNKRFAGMGELKPTEANLVAWQLKPNYLLAGQGIFKARCATCHGTEGQGITGPNLTDDYGKNLKRITDIPRVITSGANNGAMPTWGNVLQPTEIALVATYVASLRGKNLPGPPGSRLGELMPEWPKPEATTTAATAATTSDK